MRRRCNRCGNWCIWAIAFGVGLLLLMSCSLRLLLVLAAIALIVLGALVLTC